MPFDATPPPRLRAFRFERPVGWDGFEPPDVPPFIFARATGHPPPLQQIAGQVRTPSGYTAGRITSDGAVPLRLASMWGPAPRPRGV